MSGRNASRAQREPWPESVTESLQWLLDAGAVPTGEFVTVTVSERRYVREEGERFGRYEMFHEEVEMELLDGGPRLHGKRARRAMPFELLLVRLVTDPEHGASATAYTSTGGVYAREIEQGRWAWPWIDTCPECGQGVIWVGVRHRDDAPRYCTQACRSRARRPHVDRTRKCDWCGELFTPVRAHAETCSTRCRVARHRARGARSGTVTAELDGSPGACTESVTEEGA